MGLNNDMRKVIFLRVVCPQDGSEVLEPPELVDGSEPLTAVGHKSGEASTACRNPTRRGNLYKAMWKSAGKSTGSLDVDFGYRIDFSSLVTFQTAHNFTSTNF